MSAQDNYLHSLLMGMMLLASAQFAGAKVPEIPLTDDMRVTSLGDNMRVNGNDVSVRTFTSAESAQDVIDFYRDEWGEANTSEPGYTVNNAQKPWTVISRIEDDYLLTVQVQPTGDDSSKGMLSISPLPDRNRPPKLGAGFPTMGGSRVLNEVASKDAGQSGRTMMLGNKHDMATNVDFYRNRYVSEGWSFDMDRDLGGVMHVLALRKSRNRLNLVLSNNPKGGTVIVVNEVKHDLL